jgi:hypothetical protein
MSDPIIISVKDKHKKREHLRQYRQYVPVGGTPTWEKM